MAASASSSPEFRQYPENSLLYNLSFITVFGLWAADYFVAIPVALNLVLTSTAIVVLGSYRSLRMLDPDAVPHDEKETLSSTDAMKFPVVASCSLYGLYYAFKNFDKDTVNMILACYFSLAGVVTLTSTFSPFVSGFIRGSKKYGFKKTFPLIGEVDLTFTRAEQFCLLVSIVFAYAYYDTKHYMLNNVLGISFCVQGLEKVSIGSYKIGAGLLTGLFFYDIFWVFGVSEVICNVFLDC
jgi:minor histocompatibility antigen H13